MPHQHIVIICQEPQLSESIRARLDHAATVTVLPGLRRRLPKPSPNGPHLFLVESSLASSPGLSKLLRACQNGASPYVIIGSAEQLIQASNRLRDNGTTVFREANAEASPPSQEKRPHQAALDVTLSDFMERKFKEFVRKIRLSGGKNLYNILLQEFEKPLISLTLKETNGNQVQAAYMLGVNRNTLRKKIKELKIPIKR